MTNFQFKQLESSLLLKWIQHSWGILNVRKLGRGIFRERWLTTTSAWNLVFLEDTPTYHANSANIALTQDTSMSINLIWGNAVTMNLDKGSNTITQAWTIGCRSIYDGDDLCLWAFMISSAEAEKSPFLLEAQTLKNLLMGSNFNGLRKAVMRALRWYSDRSHQRISKDLQSLPGSRHTPQNTRMGDTDVSQRLRTR